MNLEVRNINITSLAPIVQAKLTSSIATCHELGYPVKLFEGYRSPERQDFLYAMGRTIPGKIVTNRRAWQSFHGVGLAVDIVFRINGRWSWDKSLPWDKVAAVFKEYGFKWLAPFEQVHFEITGGMRIEDAVKIYREQSPEALWKLIS